MSKEIFVALSSLEKELGVPEKVIIEKIEKSISTACKSNYGNSDVVVDIKPDEETFDVFLNKRVSDDVRDNGTEISIEDAKKINPEANIEDVIAVRLDTKEFGRIAAQTARNIIRQGIRDTERDQIMGEFRDLKYQMVSATIVKTDPVSGTVTLRIGKLETFLPLTQQIGTEVFRENDHIKVYVTDIKETAYLPKIMVSRSHPQFVAKLFELEVPEIQDGVIEIKSVSREAGVRTKIAVFSNNPDVDPIGSLIGNMRSRIDAVIEELGGEKIDIVLYNEDPVVFVSSALSPAQVLSVEFGDEQNSCRVVVPNSQLSLAIGSRGQNVRLAARLTHLRIDIVPEYRQ